MVKFEGDQATSNMDATLKEYFSLFSNDLLHPDHNLFYTDNGLNQKNLITFGDAVSTHRFNKESGNVAKFKPVIPDMDYIKKLRHVGNVIAMAILNKQVMDMAFDERIYDRVIAKKIHKFIIRPKYPSQFEDLFPSDDNPTDLTFDMDEYTEVFISDAKPTFELNYFPPTSEPVTIYSDREGYTLTFTDDRVFQEAMVMVNEFETDETYFSMAVLCRGIFEIIPQDAFTRLRFDRDEIRALISGETRPLDSLDWIRLGLPDLNTIPMYRRSLVKSWFCEYLEASSEIGPYRLLSFITGISRLPVGLLDGAHDASKPYINILLLGEAGSLPTSDPYTNTLYLPSYTSKEKLQEHFAVILENLCGAPIWFVSAAKSRSCPKDEL